MAGVLSDSTTILDGELYVHGWSLQRINSAVAVKRSAPSTDTPYIEYHVFDCVKFNTSFSDRTHTVRELLTGKGLKFIIPVPTSLVFTQSQADAFFARQALSGYEGCMYRLGDCLYTLPSQGSTQDNRVQHMLKRKAWRDGDFRVVGVCEGKETDKGGKYLNGLGAFECITESGKLFTAAPAFTDNERQHYWDNPPIGATAIVKYLNLSDDGIPLNPTVLAIREA